MKRCTAEFNGNAVALVDSADKTVTVVVPGSSASARSPRAAATARPRV